MDERSTKPPAKPLSLRKKLLFSVIATVWFLAVAEASLWLIGFEYRPGSVSIEEHGKPSQTALRRSTDSGWELEPGSGDVGASGFIGPDIPLKRTAGVLRIAAIGDSCTHFGDPPYIELVRDRLSEQLGRPVESLNAGVTGYSTHQGLIRLKRDVLKYKPDVVVIYFGWNDHWVAQGVTDRGKEVLLNQSTTKILWQLDRFKIVQAGLYLSESLRAKPPMTFRVPIDEYKNNLRQIIETVREAGAIPIVVTAATDATPETTWGEFAELPASLAENYESPRAIHQLYVDATRDVAAEKEATIVDAALELDCKSDLFLRDHIHPNQHGYEELASLIADSIEQSIPK